MAGTPRFLTLADVADELDAVADGTQTSGHGSTRSRLQLHGRGVRPARLTLVTIHGATRVTGTVGGRRVALRLGSPA